mmetsp:Transcript_1427/g.3451  ORF Transcript_1427/g.3451 Transcript_1427/m.3451 type:complete len:279 (-) Transcript_1427:728-1564(-)
MLSLMAHGGWDVAVCAALARSHARAHDLVLSSSRASSRRADRVGRGRRGGRRRVVRVDVGQLVGAAPHTRGDQAVATHLVEVAPIGRLVAAELVAHLLAALAVDVRHVHQALGQVLLVLAARLELAAHEGVGEAGVLRWPRAEAPPPLGAEQLVRVAQRSVARAAEQRHERQHGAHRARVHEAQVADAQEYLADAILGARLGRVLLAVRARGLARGGGGLLGGGGAGAPTPRQTPGAACPPRLHLRCRLRRLQHRHLLRRRGRASDLGARRRRRRDGA